MPGPSSDARVPVVAAAEMGYGHLRPAQSIADALGLPVHRVDAPPLATASEVRTWSRHRRTYETVSRLTQSRLIGRPFLALLEYLTKIDHLLPRRDQSRPTRSVKALSRLLEKEVMGGLFDLLELSGGPLVTTFYAPAVAADLRGIEGIWCVVTDSDIHRIWAPPDAARTKINYLVPSRRARRRLRAYGVPHERIEFTGFPLPGSLAREDAARRNLVARLRRLDPNGVFREERAPEIQTVLPGLPVERQDGRAPLLTLAVGGAGAQVRMALELVEGLTPMIREGRLRVVLVAGVHQNVAEEFQGWLSARHPGSAEDDSLRILHEPDFVSYYRAFNDLLAETDILWTKPSELVFYAALGIPLLLAPPIGCHERYNRRYLLERGAAVPQRDLRLASGWVEEMLADGTLASTAWSGFRQLPRDGTDRIVRSIGEVT